MQRQSSGHEICLGGQLAYLGDARSNPMSEAHLRAKSATAAAAPLFEPACDRLFADLQHLETIRLDAARPMGMGDVSRSVTPKFGLLAPPPADGVVTARHFMPFSYHPTLALTGAQCPAAGGADARNDGRRNRGAAAGSPALVTLEHPSSAMTVTVDWQNCDDGFMVCSARVLPTARLLARGAKSMCLKRCCRCRCRHSPTPLAG